MSEQPPLTDDELRALRAIVEFETAILNADVAAYGAPQSNPHASGNAWVLEREVFRRINARAAEVPDGVG